MRCGTIYSWVGELGTDEIHVALGRPCENEHQLYKLDAISSSPSTVPNSTPEVGK